MNGSERKTIKRAIDSIRESQRVLIRESTSAGTDGKTSDAINAAVRTSCQLTRELKDIIATS
jgi:hypothetical protein